ncbi:hypothetical protein PM082_011628 [Marasmius tenuissimus]|nr:hypothetical protein PM082_011628 [Marasmius tenuissimus]
MTRHEHQLPTSAFFALQLIGGLGLFVLALIAALSRNINRHPTWYSFCASWCMSAISYSLLLLTGQSEKAPSFSICSAQSALVYSSPVLTASSTFAMFIYVYFTIHAALTKADLSHIRRFRMLLIIIPYVLFTVFTFGLLVFAAKQPDYVQKADNGYYCNFATEVPLKICSGVSFLFLTAIVVFEAMISVRLFRQWNVLAAVPKAVGMAVRVLIFGFGVALAWILCFIYLFPIDVGPSVDIILAILPVIGLIIFATQKDLYFSWRLPDRLGLRGRASAPTPCRVECSVSSVTSVTPLTPGKQERV